MVNKKNQLPKLVKSKELVFQKLGDQFVIFNSQNSQLFTFNETAGLILEKIKAGWSREQLIDFMSKNYQKDKQMIENDLEELCKDLKKYHLVK